MEKSVLWQLVGYLTEPVSFDDILGTLSDLEHRINLYCFV